MSGIHHYVDVWIMLGVIEGYSIFSLLRPPWFRRFAHGDLSKFDIILTVSVKIDICMSKTPRNNIFSARKALWDAN